LNLVTINSNLDEQVTGQYCLSVPFQNNINCQLPFTTQMNAIVILFALNCSLEPENGKQHGKLIRIALLHNQCFSEALIYEQSMKP
jgi:hypothetical protein